jgi:hypothetical protein
MAKLEIKYRLEGKALPPRPIKVAIGDWGGSAERKKEHGSRPEPWHCPPFTDACIHGFELLYQYETEMQVVNVNGKVEFKWNLEKEPGGGGDPRKDFIYTHPPEKDYIFNTSLDIQVPPGYVLRIEPHPRFYVDETETVAPAYCGHIQSDWWPKELFVVFKNPARRCCPDGDDPRRAGEPPQNGTRDGAGQDADRQASLGQQPQCGVHRLLHRPVARLRSQRLGRR